MKYNEIPQILNKASGFFGITKDLRYFIYIMKMKSESIIKCILAKGDKNNKKSILLKPPLY